jgi:hypothetical protein
MPYESLGSLSAVAIKALKEAKLLMIVRGTEVHIDSSEHARAAEILNTVKNPVETVYRFYGFTMRVSKDLPLESRWYGYPNTLVGRRGRVHILEFSKPTNGLDNNAEPSYIEKVKIKGEEVVLNVNAYTPAYSGVVMCDDGGVPLFEVVPWNIFVLFDPRGNQTATKKIYEANMLTFAIILANHGDEKSVAFYNEIWGKQAKDREKYEIKQFRDMMAGTIKKEISTLEKNIATGDARMKALKTQLHQEGVAICDSENRLVMLKNSVNENIEKKATEEWEKLKALERKGAVSNIRVTADRISFATREIKWTPSKLPCIMSTPDYERGADVTIDEPVPIGRFEVTVFTTAGQFAIEINNTTKTIAYSGYSWHHPHVKEGSVCRGNMTEAVPQFAARREFEAVVMCILKWLENVDVRDAWGKGIYYWWKDYIKSRPKKAETVASPPQVPSTVT